MKPGKFLPETITTQMITPALSLNMIKSSTYHVGNTVPVNPLSGVFVGVLDIETVTRRKTSELVINDSTP